MKTSNNIYEQGNTSLNELRKERHHIAAKISGRKKTGKDITELKEQEAVIVAMIAKITKQGNTKQGNIKKATVQQKQEPKKQVKAKKTTVQQKQEPKKQVKAKKGTVQQKQESKKQVKAKKDTVQPVLSQEQPKNEIWYTSTDGMPVNIMIGNFGKGIVAKSNEYENGKGVIRCNGIITSIGRLAFYGCKNLASVILPESVEEIDTFAFANCKNLTNMTCKSPIPPLTGLNIFGNTPNNCTIHVEPRHANTYRNAGGWIAYKDNIRAI